MNKKEIDIIAWLRWVCTGIAGASLLASVFFATRGGVFAQDWGEPVPIYILSTMGNFVEYIISGYLNGGYTDGTAAAGFFIIGVAYAFLAVLAWAKIMLIAFLKIKISWK